MVIAAYLGVSGLLDVGYRFYTSAESAVAGRVTAGIVDAADGWYSVDTTIPATTVSVRWDSTGTPTAVAREYFGVTVDNNAIAVAVWQVLASTLTTTGTVGKLVADNINATISSRSTYAGADTAGTTTLLSRIASVLTITSGKVDINDKTGFGLTSAYDAAKNAMPAGPVTLTAAQVTAVADELLKRDWVQVSGEAGASLLNAIRSLRNRWQLSIDGTLTIFKEDGSTVAWTRVVTTNSNALPITGMS
jgi:hypothetical protein